jgi:hypothetical protein
LLQFAGQQGIRPLVLMGGTPQGHNKAIRLCQAAGFIEAGLIDCHLLNYNMYLPLTSM